jgi:DNA-binding NtrC family response regulator
MASGEDPPPKYKTVQAWLRIMERKPLLSGIELAIQVREYCPDCKVLLFSGQAASAGLLETARANGYDFEFLLKPVHPSDLLATIRNLTEAIVPLPPAKAQRAWR